MEMRNCDQDALRTRDGNTQLRSRCIMIENRYWYEDALRWICKNKMQMHWDGDAQLRSRRATEIKMHNCDAQLRCIKMEMCNWDWVFTEMRMHNWDRDGDAQLRCRWRCATEIEMHQDGDAQTEIEMHQDKDAQLRSRWKCATERFRCSTNGGSGHQLQLLSHEKSDCIS